MRFHRIIWIVAILSVLAAAATLLVRNDRLEPDTDNALFAQLEKDPSADTPETKAAIKQAAEAALLESNPMAEDCYALGLYHSDQEAFDTAETDFREAITLNPGWSWPYNALGVLLANHAKNRTREAEELFRTAIQLDPQWSRPYNDLAILLRIAGRLDEAEQMASTALRLDPEDLATHNNYGNLLVVRKRYDEAEPHYRKAIELDPNHPKPYYNLACLCSLRGQKDEALSLLAKAVALSPILRRDARRDPDFNPIRNTPEFKKITVEGETGKRR